MIELPEKFMNRMKSALGADFSLFKDSYLRPPEKGIRVNTLKIPVGKFAEISPFALEPNPWEPSAFYVTADKTGKTLCHAAGLYYAQEPSASAVVPRMGIERGDKVLDLCAAPGGKSTQIAQYLGGEGLLVANEVNFSRAKILSQNIERLGVKNSIVACADCRQLCEKFKGYFDKILVDAPCSGEGMFRKEPAAVGEWSEENVALCAQRQRDILGCADIALKAGGVLVYSTCTFSPQEDEEQVSRFLDEYCGYTLLEMEKIYPHEARGEGHFYAVLKKGGDCAEGAIKPFRPVISANSLSVFGDWRKQNLTVAFGNLHEADGVIYSLPENAPDFSGLRTLRAGIRLGEVKGKIFTPSHSLAMCLDTSQAKTVELDEDTAGSFIFGLTFGTRAEGWRLATYNGFALGWCKCSGGVAKNHYPKGLRINK